MDLQIWADHQLIPGTEWNKEILDKLKESQVILLLLSPDFIISEFCYTIEMKEALILQKQKRALIIPILLSEMNTIGHPFSEIQSLPVSPRYYAQWPDKDAACAHISTGVQNSIENFIKDIVQFRKMEIESLVEEGKLEDACKRLMDFAKDFSSKMPDVLRAKGIMAAYKNLIINKKDDFNQLMDVTVSILTHMESIIPEQTLRSAA